VIGASRFNMPMGILPGSGTRTVSFHMPLINGAARSFYLQGLFVGGGEVSLGTATQVHVLDAGL
jgi:hypothetical protein